MQGAGPPLAGEFVLFFASSSGREVKCHLLDNTPSTLLGADPPA